LAHSAWGNYTFQLGFAVASGVASGIAYASILALFMDLTHPQFAATHFQLYMALQNTRGAWGGRVGGRLAERLPPTSMFGLGALLEIAPLAMLFLLDPRKTREAFQERAPSGQRGSGSNV